MTASQEMVDGFLANMVEEIAKRTAQLLTEQAPAPTRLLTLDQVGEQLGISRKSVQTMIANGILASVKIGPGEFSARVEQAEVDRYIVERRLASRSVT